MSYSYQDKNGWWHTFNLVDNNWVEVSIYKTGVL